MRYITLFFIALSASMYAQETALDKVIYQKNDIAVYKVIETEEYKDATIELSNLIQKDKTNDLLATFDIKNYTLKANSNNNISGLCASSNNGQHIHFIIDNKPYKALYENNVKWTEEKGSHLMLAFLSRAHHQSIKSSNAYVLKNFTVGKKTKKNSETSPYMFYSRPKGTYVDGDTKDILLDFYLANCTLSKDGYKVRVTLDNTYTFTLTDWSPYIIKGLTMGEHKITMTLLDSKNKTINTPFNPVNRTFILMQNP